MMTESELENLKPGALLKTRLTKQEIKIGCKLIGIWPSDRNRPAIFPNTIVMFLGKDYLARTSISVAMVLWEKNIVVIFPSNLEKI